MDPYDQTLLQLTATLAVTSRTYKSAVDKVAAEYGLSQATGLPVLLIGRLGGGVRPGVLADAIGLEASSVVRLVDHLIESGLLERRDDPQDRRAKILELTAEGKHTADLMERALIPFRSELFSGFERADVEACLRVLAGLNTAILKRGDNAAGSKAA
jgi:MarR family transcriptional regulator for hemolysin